MDDPEFLKKLNDVDFQPRKLKVQLVNRTSPGAFEKILIKEKAIPAPAKHETIQITFQRTLFLPTNGSSRSYDVPAKMGTFPLYSVEQHAKDLPPLLGARGGVWIPMFRESLPKRRDLTCQFAFRNANLE